MGQAGSPLMLGSQVANTALQAVNTGLKFRHQKKQARRQREALKDQIQEEMRIHMFQQAQRANALAQAVGSQVANLYGVGVMQSMGTGALLQASAEMSKRVQDAEAAASTASAIGQLVTGIEQSILGDRNRVVSTIFDSVELGLTGATSIGQSGTDIKDSRSFKVDTTPLLGSG